MIFLLKVIELFGGIGAFTNALHKLNINHEIVDYVEANKNAVIAYNALYNQSFKPCRVEHYNLPKGKKIDILMHGSPCQDFSRAGNHAGGEKGSGTRSSLLFETIRILSQSDIKPTWVIWENVKAVLDKNFKNTFHKYVFEMETLGYHSKYTVLNAYDFGIPQKRERIFVVSRFKKNNFSFEEVHKTKSPSIRKFLEPCVHEKYTVTQKSILSKIDGTSTSSFKGRARIIDDFCYTILTNQVTIPNAGFVRLSDDKYRYLTEKECCRLMGFSNRDYALLYKIFKPRKEHLKSSILYKLFGNSIVVNVLMEIVKEIERVEQL